MCVSGGCNAQDYIKVVEGRYQLVFFSPEVIATLQQKVEESTGRRGIQ